MMEVVRPEDHARSSGSALESSPKVFVVRERVWESVVSDSFTLGMLAMLPWFNYRYGGGSGWIYAAISIAWFVGLLSRLGGKTKEARKSPAEVRAWLDKNFPLSSAKPAEGESLRDEP